MKITVSPLWVTGVSELHGSAWVHALPDPLGAT
jgi:hypothetical protein